MRAAAVQVVDVEQEAVEVTITMPRSLLAAIQRYDSDVGYVLRRVPRT